MCNDDVRCGGGNQPAKRGVSHTLFQVNIRRPYKDISSIYVTSTGCRRVPYTQLLYAGSHAAPFVQLSQKQKAFDPGFFKQTLLCALCRSDRGGRPPSSMGCSAAVKSPYGCSTVVLIGFTCPAIAVVTCFPAGASAHTADRSKPPPFRWYAHSYRLRWGQRRLYLLMRVGIPRRAS